MDCTASAISFMSNIRTPSTVLAAAAMGMVWVQPGNRRGPWLRTLHIFLVAATVMCEFASIAVSQITTIQLQAGAYDPMAVSPLP